jgi:hypothetical protein
MSKKGRTMEAGIGRGKKLAVLVLISIRILGLGGLCDTALDSWVG